MKKEEINYLINVLEEIIEEKSLKKNLISLYQNIVWSLTDSSEEYDILSELAYDLDYYESDPETRKEDKSYYGDDKLISEAQQVIKQIKSFTL